METSDRSGGNKLMVGATPEKKKRNTGTGVSAMVSLKNIASMEDKKRLDFQFKLPLHFHHTLKKEQSPIVPSIRVHGPSHQRESGGAKDDDNGGSAQCRRVAERDKEERRQAMAQREPTTKWQMARRVFVSEKS